MPSPLTITSSIPTVVLPTSLSKQVGSVPAEGSGPNAAKIDPQSLTKSSSITRIDSAQSSDSSSTRSKQIGSVPAQGSGPGAATFNIESSSAALSTTSGTMSNGQEIQSVSVSSTQLAQPPTVVSSSSNTPATTFVTRFSLGTAVATPASSPQSFQFPPVTSQAGSGTLATPTTVQSQQSTVAIPVISQSPTRSSAEVATGSSTAGAAGPSLSVLPSASGNLAIARTYNKQFSSLTPDSQCDPRNRLQANVCINGLFASCTDAGRYSTSRCGEGMQCFALPLPAGSTGVFVKCELPSEAIRQLQQEGNADGSSATGSIATTATAFLTTATSTIALTSSSFAASPNPSQAQISPTLAITPLGFSTGTTSGNAQSNTAATPDAETKPSTTPTSFGTAATFTTVKPSVAATSKSAIETSTTQTISVTATISSVTQASPTSTILQSTTSAAASSTDVPLIISFPSSLSSSFALQSAQEPRPTKLLNQAPAPTGQTSVAVAETSIQPSPSQQSPNASPTPAASATSTFSPEVTIVPLGGDNGNIRERFITVTVTTTERL